jgi:hypothetical protein
MTSPSSNAGESKPLSVDLASTDCMAESLAMAVKALEDADRALHGAWQMLSAIHDSDPSRDRAKARDRAIAAWERNGAAIVVLRAALPSPSLPAPTELEECAYPRCLAEGCDKACGVAPSVPVVHEEGGEQPKNHSFNLGSSGDGPESLSSANDTSRSGDRQ